MHNLVQPFPRKTKAPLFAVATAASGTLEASSPGTYTLTDAQGEEVASGAVDASSSPNALTVQEWKTLDGNALELSPGNYSIEFLLNLVGGNGQQERRSYSIILSVPGSRAYPKYPSGIDLQVYLVGAGMLANPPAKAAMLLDLDGAIETAISTWQRLTGWHPFLVDADADPTTRVFDPPGPSAPHWRYAGGGWELDLRSGVVSVDAVTQNGTDYIIGGDSGQVYLLPSDAPERGRPYDSLRFGYAVYGTPQSISVSAQWGFATSLPADVWTLLLQMAAAELLPQLAQLRTGGLSSWKAEDAAESYTQNPFAVSSDHWDTQKKKTVSRYKRSRFA